MSEQSKTKVTSLTMARVFNLGNYANVRYDITVDVGEGDSASVVLLNLNNVMQEILDPKYSINARLSEAFRTMKRPEQERTEDEKRFLISMQSEIQAHQLRVQKWQEALAKLDHLAVSETYTDRKADWALDPDGQ